MFHLGSTSGPALNQFNGIIEATEVLISAFNQVCLLSRCDLIRGMSGGGTFDANGNFIGMIIGSNNETTASMLAKDIYNEWIVFKRRKEIDD